MKDSGCSSPSVAVNLGSSVCFFITQAMTHRSKRSAVSPTWLKIGMLEGNVGSNGTKGMNVAIMTICPFCRREK